MSFTAELAEQLAIADRESDYVAVELLWNILVKAAHSQSGHQEYKRIQSLLKDLETSDTAHLMKRAAIDALLDLDPPLETILVDPNERLDTKQAAKELGTIRANRFTNPRTALDALFFVLKRVRNKRVHGFKSQKGPRDAEILDAARALLSALCHALI